MCTLLFTLSNRAFFLICKSPRDRWKMWATLTKSSRQRYPTWVRPSWFRRDRWRTKIKKSSKTLIIRLTGVKTHPFIFVVVNVITIMRDHRHHSLSCRAHLVVVCWTCYILVQHHHRHRRSQLKMTRKKPILTHIQLHRHT